MTDKPIPKPRPPKPTTPSKKSAQTSASSQAKRLKVQISRAERAKTVAEKRLAAVQKVQDAMNGTGAKLVSTDELDLLAPTAKTQIDEDRIIFKPNPGPQEEFLSTSVRECLYGGAAGGGKSYALLADALRYAGYRDYRAVVFRRTNDELRELIWKSKELYPRAFPGAKWAKQESTWTFPSGATIWFTYLESDDDVSRMQGQSFCACYWDELTHWPTPFAYIYMRSRLRSTNPEIPLVIRATTNPGGSGSAWVRKLFVDAAPWGTIFPAVDIEKGTPLVYPEGHAKAGQPMFYSQFIPAKLTDNPYLMKDGNYEAQLLSLPESQRRQLLEGDWDVSENSAFPEFRRADHVIKPFDIPLSWPRFRAADWGYTSPFCVLWFAVDEDGNLYVYRELYDKKKTADVVAKMVNEAERGEAVRYGVLDSSTWANRGEVGPSIAETMIMNGCRWRPADRSPKSRAAGKAEIHRRLMLQENAHGEKKPTLFIFDSCVNLIREISTIPLDKHKPEDVDTDASDHAYDALRYGCMSRPVFRPTFSTDFAQPTFTPADSTFGY